MRAQNVRAPHPCEKRMCSRANSRAAPTSVNVNTLGYLPCGLHFVRVAKARLSEPGRSSSINKSRSLDFPRWLADAPCLPVRACTVPCRGGRPIVCFECSRFRRSMFFVSNRRADRYDGWVLGNYALAFRDFSDDCLIHPTQGSGCVPMVPSQQC